MKLNRLVLSVAALATIVPAFGMADVYFTWRGQNGIQVYSDTSKLDADNVMRVENETGFSTYFSPKQEKVTDTSQMSIEEKKLLLDQEILEENKRRLERQEKQRQEDRKNNCSVAKLNLTAIQSADRAARKDELIGQYQADIKRYCD